MTGTRSASSASASGRCCCSSRARSAWSRATAVMSPRAHRRLRRSRGIQPLPPPADAASGTTITLVRPGAGRGGPRRARLPPSASSSTCHAGHVRPCRASVTLELHVRRRACQPRLRAAPPPGPPLPLPPLRRRAGLRPGAVGADLQGRHPGARDGGARRGDPQPPRPPAPLRLGAVSRGGHQHRRAAPADGPPYHLRGSAAP